MCGILGIISETNSHLNDRQVVAMQDAMRSRGPDDSGIFRCNSATLAHRRLAIRDLEKGQQPWVSQNGRFVVVFNGEIYNDDELRRELRLEGYQCRTRCDTEVLTEAWSAWGTDCVTKLRGMFAFGVHDTHARETWLVRDRCGVKPLFYADVGGDFVFASSISAIRKHPKFSSQPNFCAIGHYLQTLRLTLSNETVFDGLYSLSPAEIYHVTPRHRTKRKYWAPPSAEKSPVDFGEASRQLEASIEEAVRLRLKSDVPVGMMMSGGVDSNTLATFTKKHTGKRVVGVCGGGVDDSMAEQGGDFDFARQCATELDFEYGESRLPAEEYLESWLHLIDQYETPLSTPTDVIIYHVAQQLKQKVGVAIGGEGADEAFCGYAVQHWSGQDYENAGRLASGHTSSVHTQISESLKRQYGQDAFTSPADHYFLTNGLVSPTAQEAIIRPPYWNKDSDCYVRHHYEILFASLGEAPMNEKYANVLFQLNLESLLSRLDGATMAASLEARVPYTDHLLVEQAFKFPHHFKIDVCPKETSRWLSSMELASRGSLRSKRILRSVAARLLPERLAQRPKMSFPTPIQTWLGRDWRSWIANKLTTSPFAKEVFHKSAIKDLAELPQSMALWNWPIINTILWGDRCFG